MKKKISKFMIVFLTLIAILFFLFPIYLAVASSFKTPLELAESVLKLPSTLYFDNYVEGMERSNFFRSMLNSCIVTFPSVVLIVFCSSMGGYTIARNGKRKKMIGMMDKIYLISLMIPFQILMIPIYRIFRALKMQNSLLAVIIVLTGTSVAYATFLYVGFVKSIPVELEEAALIDGCGPYRTFVSIVFPMLKPITATVAALHVMWLWNDFNISLILLQKDEVRTLTVKQYYFFGEFSSNYGMAFAASIVCMIPVIILFIFMQRYIVEGIAAGAVKS